MAPHSAGLAAIGIVDVGNRAALRCGHAATGRYDGMASGERPVVWLPRINKAPGVTDFLTWGVEGRLGSVDMCGICGIWNHDDEPVDRSVLTRMADRHAPSGPGRWGSYIAGPVGLGHRRLSIIDLESGRQPLSNEDGTVWITYNGEVYNFPELRVELEAKGHLFRTRTDTEVVVHLYEEMGPACVDRLRGMFSFAIWDYRRQQMMLARDRLGQKPVYYLHDGAAIRLRIRA